MPLPVGSPSQPCPRKGCASLCDGFHALKATDLQFTAAKCRELYDDALDLPDERVEVTSYFSPPPVKLFSHR